MTHHAQDPHVTSPTSRSAVSHGARRSRRAVLIGMLSLATLTAAGGCTPSRGAEYAVTLRGDVMNRIEMQPDRYAAVFPENLGIGGLGPVELASVD